MAESFIEKFAQKLRIIPNLDREHSDGNSEELRKFPSAEEWHDFKELDANAWPVRIEKNYCLLYTSPSPRDRTRSRMPSSA